VSRSCDKSGARAQFDDHDSNPINALTGRRNGVLVDHAVAGLVVALAGCLAFLLMVQQMAGIRIGMLW